MNNSAQVKSNEANINTVFWLRRIHKWLGLLLGLQLFLWVLSGLMFNWLDHKEVSGRYLLTTPEKSSIALQVDPTDVLKKYPNASSIQRVSRFNSEWWLIEDNNEQLLLDVVSLKSKRIAKPVIESEVNKRYPDVKIISTNLESERTLENRRFNLPVWRVDVLDEQESALYFDQYGQFLDIKTNSWRLFDIFWMLHIMDYSGRTDFNNALVIFVAAGTLFISLSGILLLFSVFKRQDFVLAGKNKRVPIQITSRNGFETEVFVRKNQTLIDALSKEGFDLPSNCGGGGTCGLCKVRLPQAEFNHQSSSFNKHQILSRNALIDGCRLGCQIDVTGAMTVELPEQVLKQQVKQGKVKASRFLTPLVKEIVLELDKGDELSFQAGEYMQFHCPEGSVELSYIQRPDFVDDYWRDNKINSLKGVRTDAIKRAYSMVDKPGRCRELTFLVRLEVPADDSNTCGAGSSYLFSLVPGDKVSLSGPFGEFYAEQSDDEMILLGGGVGIAPLMSHIEYQLRVLNSKRKITLFYGVRDESEVLYLDKLSQLVDEFSNFQMVIALSNAKQHSRYAIGNISDVARYQYFKQHDSLPSCQFYVCGPPKMLSSTLKILSQFNVPDSKVRFDDFGSI
jgi:Na(+)-translocating NADH:ubiquinone oxidoreductase F subunit